MARKVPPLRTARERLLAACDDLFYREGVHTTGIDRIIEKAGVAKGSLYYIFGGKDELITAYLESRHQSWLARVNSAMKGVNDPTEKILAVFDAIGDYVALPGFRGCEFVNAAAEAREGSPEMRAAERFRRSLRDFFEDLATQTGVDDPKKLADQLVVLHDGAIATAQMDKASRDAALAARQMARLALTAAGVPLTARP
jgi:AcrR family transcriptional regulator